MRSIPIPFRVVSERKNNLQSKHNLCGDITYEMVSTNLSIDNVKSFMEVQGWAKSNDMKFKQGLKLVDAIGESAYDRTDLRNDLVDALRYAVDMAVAMEAVNNAKHINESTYESLEEQVSINEACDRVLRNNDKLSRRFNFSKVIRENMGYGLSYTVHELCALIDTYEMPNKAKMNVALENINYALHSSGYSVPVNKVSDYIIEYFLNRESIITDKDAMGYINVLENNIFIDESTCELYRVLKEQNKYGLFGNYWTNNLVALTCQCESQLVAAHILEAVNIRSEKVASRYINDSINFILNESTSVKDATNLMKSIYALPLIGNIQETFIGYELETCNKIGDIKKKLHECSKNDYSLFSKCINNCEVNEMAAFVTKNIQLPKDIINGSYLEANVDLCQSMLENDFLENEKLRKEINAFKASQDKSPSKFKNFINRIITKSPENILSDMPSLFSIARGLIYIAIAASSPIGPIISGITLLVTELLGMHLNKRKAKSLMRHLQEEKAKVDKKIDKAKTDKEKRSLEEYSNCLDKAIKKAAEYVANIDEDDEEASDAQYGSGSTSDFGDFDFGGIDDIEFPDTEFNFEESVIFTSKIFDIITESLETKIEDMEIPEDINEESLIEFASIFDNCPDNISDQFYTLINDRLHSNKDNPRIVTCCTSILNNRGNGKIHTDPITESIIQYNAIMEAKKVSSNKFDLNTMKLALVNFKKKFKDLKGKEAALWRNIDITMSGLMKNIQRALTSDRREAIIKGSIIPSFSKCIKSAIGIGAIAAFVNPVAAAITAMGMLGASKALNRKERLLIYDEIDTELQVVDKEIQMAENEGDMNRYRFLLNYQKKLLREKHRIKYGIKMQGRDIPEIKGNRGE